VAVSMSFKATKPRRKPFNGAALLREANAEMDAWGGKVQEQTSRYPGAPPGSRYRRTGNLGRKWDHDTERKGDSIKTTVTNAAPYAKYVVGENQRGFHGAHGWKRIDDVAPKAWAETVANLRKLFED